MIIDPTTIEHQQVYKILIGSIVPRPIAFVSTLGKNGVNNLAPYSFFTAAASNPPTVIFCPMRKGTTGEKKDTLLNIEFLGEYVINTVSETYVEKMNLTAADLPNEVDEFEYAGFTPVDSEIVIPKRVLESPVSFECKLDQIVPVGYEGVGGGSVVIGTVVRMHVKDEIFDNYRIDVDQTRPVGRMAGNWYTRVTDRFELVRPKTQG